ESMTELTTETTKLSNPTAPVRHMDVSLSIEQVFREERARVLAALVRSIGDFELAEDALQEAFASALVHWERGGPPDAPAAWLLTVARHRAIDRLRHQRTGEAKLDQLGVVLESTAVA